MLHLKHGKIKTGYAPVKRDSKPQSVQPNIKPVLQERVPMLAPLSKPIEILNPSTTMRLMTTETDVDPMDLNLPYIEINKDFEENYLYQGQIKRKN